MVVTKNETNVSSPPLPEPTLSLASSSSASVTTGTTKTSKKKGPTKSSMKNKRPSSLVSKNKSGQKENFVAKQGSFKRLKVTFDEDNTKDDHPQHKMSTPEHSSMISTFLSTPLFQRRNNYGYEPRAPSRMYHHATSLSSPSVSTAGVRVLFHCSPRAVKYSPLVPVQLPSSSPPPSPMMSMVNMDLDCFEKAMNALSPPHHHHNGSQDDESALMLLSTLPARKMKRRKTSRRKIRFLSFLQNKTKSLYVSMLILFYFSKTFIVCHIYYKSLFTTF